MPSLLRKQQARSPRPSGDQREEKKERAEHSVCSIYLHCCHLKGFARPSPPRLTRAATPPPRRQGSAFSRYVSSRKGVADTAQGECRRRGCVLHHQRLALLSEASRPCSSFCAHVWGWLRSCVCVCVTVCVCVCVCVTVLLALP